MQKVESKGPKLSRTFLYVTKCGRQKVQGTAKKTSPGKYLTLYEIPKVCALDVSTKQK